MVLVTRPRLALSCWLPASCRVGRQLLSQQISTSVTCVVRSKHRPSLSSAILSVARKVYDLCASADRCVIALIGESARGCTPSLDVSLPVCWSSASSASGFRLQVFGQSLEVHEHEPVKATIAAHLLYSRWQGKPSCVWLQYCSTLRLGRAHGLLLVLAPTYTSTSPSPRFCC